MGKRGRCGLQETRGAHKMKRIRIKLSSFRLCALCVLFLQNPALLRGDDGLATATRHIMRGAATAATYTQTAGKLRWAWSLQESDHLGSGRLGVRLLASGGVGSILRLSGGRGVPRNGLESGEGGYGEYDSDGDGDVDGDDVEATRRGQQQQGAGDAGVDGDEPGGSDDDMAARLVNGAGDEWEERHKQNQEAMQNMKGFANEEAFLQAKQAYEDGDEDAFEKMQKKVEAEETMDPQERLFWRMERYAKPWPPDWLERMQDQENPVVFLDVAIRALDRKSTIEHEGRITIELFSHTVPRTAENFRCFCTGEVQDPRRGKAVGYKDVLFHRIVNGYCVQGGDFVKFDGTGCYSIFGGERFADEDFGGKHSAGAVSMANAGVPDSNGCQFFITTAKEAPFFDGKHVVFGQVIDGMDTVGKIEQVPVVGRDYKPLRKVIVEECGQLK